jgi:hypothetical protein
MLQEDGGMGLLCGWGISLPKPYGVHIRGGGGGVTKLFDTSAWRVTGPPTWLIGSACSRVLPPCPQLGCALRLCHFLSAPVMFHLLATVLMIASRFPSVLTIFAIAFYFGELSLPSHCWLLPLKCALVGAPPLIRGCKEESFRVRFECAPRSSCLSTRGAVILYTVVPEWAQREVRPKSGPLHFTVGGGCGNSTVDVEYYFPQVVLAVGGAAM